jgi:hypothetical protein
LYVGRNTESIYGYYKTNFQVTKRSSPTVTVISVSGTSGQVSNGDLDTNLGASDAIVISTKGFLPRNTSGGTINAVVVSWHYTADSEL